MPDKSLLIASIYGPSERNKEWYFLQRKFISKTTLIPFDFKLVLNKVSSDIFEEKHILLRNKKNIGHPAAIEQIVEFVKANQRYSSILLLDSDCFPDRAGWHSVLDQQMAKYNKQIAAPIRYENLDSFPHPCAVYMDRVVVDEDVINFSYTETLNLLGDIFEEVGGAMINHSARVLPLLRTNRINLHPVAAGVYHHLFYHHAAGSRGFDFRLTKRYSYYDHWMPQSVEEQVQLGKSLERLLFLNPERFIDKLMYGY